MTQNNFLSPLHFGFKLARTPNLEYAVQTASIPGMTLTTVDVPTPFVKIKDFGGIEYGNLQVTFKVGENLEGYLEIHNWMNTIGRPDQLSTFENLKSDCSIIVFTASKQPLFDIHFTSAYPVEIGPLNFDATQTQLQYMTVDVNFSFLRYTINTLV